MDENIRIFLFIYQYTHTLSLPFVYNTQKNCSQAGTCMSFEIDISGAHQAPLGTNDCFVDGYEAKGTLSVMCACLRTALLACVIFVPAFLGSFLVIVYVDIGLKIFGC